VRRSRTLTRVDIDLAGVERELCRIPEVRAARIVADTGGTPVEVHVLASPGKQAKQLVRDVQSVALAASGLDIDHRIVSVVQLDDGNGSAPEQQQVALDAVPNRDREAPVADETGGERVVFESASAVRRGLSCTAEVVLRRGAQVVTGSAEGSPAAAATQRLVAEAALAGLRALEPEATRADVETATVIQVGERQVALTTIVLVVPPNEEVVCGSAPVRSGDVHEALARAVLAALNRRLPALR
jgi:hypothetical protein